MSPFRYPRSASERRHGPLGYASYESYRPWLRDDFSFRCVYCLLREQWGRAQGTFDLDHYVPVASDPGAALEYGNLVYACRACNAVKWNQRVPDPCRALIDESVIVLPDGRVAGHTPMARKVIRSLVLNNAVNVRFRKMWIDVVNLARRYDRELFHRLMCFPDDLPDLSRRRPPGGNARPEGVGQSFFERREHGELEKMY